MSLNLPCRYIFYIRRQLEVELFSVTMIPASPRLDNELIEVNSAVQTMVTNVENINSMSSVVKNKSNSQTTK
jgi:hypothetical protein